MADKTPTQIPLLRGISSVAVFASGLFTGLKNRMKRKTLSASRLENHEQYNKKGKAAAVRSVSEQELLGKSSQRAFHAEVRDESVLSVDDASVLIGQHGTGRGLADLSA